MQNLIPPSFLGTSSMGLDHSLLDGSIIPISSMVSIPVFSCSTIFSGTQWGFCRIGVVSSKMILCIRISVQPGLSWKRKGKDWTTSVNCCCWWLFKCERPPGTSCVNRTGSISVSSSSSITALTIVTRSLRSWGPLRSDSLSLNSLRRLTCMTCLGCFLSGHKISDYWAQFSDPGTWPTIYLCLMVAVPELSVQVLSPFPWHVCRTILFVKVGFLWPESESSPTCPSSVRYKRWNCTGLVSLLSILLWAHPGGHKLAYQTKAQKERNQLIIGDLSIKRRKVIHLSLPDSSTNFLSMFFNVPLKHSTICLRVKWHSSDSLNA